MRAASPRRRAWPVAVSPRRAATPAALVAATFAAVVASVGVGEFPISPLDVVRALFGAGDSATSFIVVDLRLPRALTGVLAGAALGVAGAVFQDVTRNPLVAPDIVGVAGGAALVAVTLIVFGPSGAPVPPAALAGALLTGALLYALSRRHGVQGHRLVLVGIGVAAFMQAGITYVLAKGRIFEVAQAYVWYVGSLNGRGWDQVWPLAATLAVLLPALLALGRALDVLALGDELATGLGLRVERARLLLLATAVVLTGVAVAATGPIGFVAFISPHIARRISRGDPLLVSPLCGALLVCLADLVGRLAFSPTQIPVGIVTSVIAAPYFLLLLRRAGVTR